MLKGAYHYELNIKDNVLFELIPKEPMPTKEELAKRAEFEKTLNDIKNNLINDLKNDLIKNGIYDDNCDDW